MAWQKYDDCLEQLRYHIRQKDTWAIRAYIFSRLLELVGVDTSEIMKAGKYDLIPLFGMEDSALVDTLIEGNFMSTSKTGEKS